MPTFIVTYRLRADRATPGPLKVTADKLSTPFAPSDWLRLSIAGQGLVAAFNPAEIESCIMQDDPTDAAAAAGEAADDVAADTAAREVLSDAGVTHITPRLLADLTKSRPVNASSAVGITYNQQIVPGDDAALAVAAAQRLSRDARAAMRALGFEMAR